MSQCQCVSIHWRKVMGCQCACQWTSKEINKFVSVIKRVARVTHTFRRQGMVPVFLFTAAKMDYNSVICCSNRIPMIKYVLLTLACMVTCLGENGQGMNLLHTRWHLLTTKTLTAPTKMEQFVLCRLLSGNQSCLECKMRSMSSHIRITTAQCVHVLFHSRKSVKRVIPVHSA